LFTRLLVGIIVGLAGGAFIALLIGNSFPAEPVLGAGGLIGGVVAVLAGAFDWLAGPPPKKKGS
jgi:hypothetical protein